VASGLDAGNLGRQVQALTQRSDSRHLVLQVTDDYIRDVIHAFQERGFNALDSEGAGTIAEDQ
jgi:hypothetical protein